MTTALCLLVWAGYNSELDYTRSPQFPGNPYYLLHGLRAFAPMLAAVIGLTKIAKVRSLPRWMAFSPLSLMFFYGVIGLASSLIVSNDPPLAIYWALQFLSVIVVIVAISSNRDPEAHLRHFISVNWIICAIVCVGLLASGGATATPTSGSPLGVEAYGRVQDVMGMAGSRNTGFGRFAGIVVIVALAKLFHDIRKKSTLIFWAPLMLVASFALLLSQARTSWISVVVAFVALLLRAPNRWRVPILTIAVLALPIVFITGFSTHFFEYLTRGQTIDPTLTGRISTWADGWDALAISPLVGLGFWADRLFLHGQNMQSTFLDALLQSGYLGFIAFAAALIWVAVGVIRFYSTKPGVERESLPGEILAVVAFMTVYSITEITASFYSVGWIVLAPVFAHVQLRVYRASARRRIRPRNHVTNPLPTRPAPQNFAAKSGI